MMQTQNFKIIHLKMCLDRDNLDRFFLLFNPFSDHLHCKSVTGTRFALNHGSVLNAGRVNVPPAPALAALDVIAPF